MTTTTTTKKTKTPPSEYTADAIRSLDWREHIRMRPGMYIGKLGDGSQADDGIYVLVKEIMDNAIDEHVMGAGTRVEVTITEHQVRIRDFGRGIPLEKVVDCVSKINTGGKYDSTAFKKSVGLNGVGTKAVNALSRHFRVQSFRDGKTKVCMFERGLLTKDEKITNGAGANGTDVAFVPDGDVFIGYSFRPEILEQMFWHYAFLNRGLTIAYNGKEFFSKNGLLDLLEHHLQEEDVRYPIVLLRGKDIEIAFTHGDSYGEDYYSFVNGQHTTMGGTHQAALREGIVKTIRDHFKKDYDAADVRSGIIAAISVRIEEPVFESQTKTKLGSQAIRPDGPALKGWVADFLKSELDAFLYRNTAVAQELQKKILQSERERKEIAGIKKLANDRARKANVFNKKLRDCRAHFTGKDKKGELSTLFITEGDSASGSLTKARDVQTQAVFSLRGKPLNCFGLTKKVVYENEEFNLLQHALDIEDGFDNLRYNRIVIATDADVDGMHIRLLMMTFFLQFFPELVRQGHVYILETPLFRVRDKDKTFYCYDEVEKKAAMAKLKGKPEITRFKGLGEISPDEFKQFITEGSMRLDPVRVGLDTSVQSILRYYMGKNTQERQDFIIDHLRVTEDILV